MQAEGRDFYVSDVQIGDLHKIWNFFFIFMYMYITNLDMSMEITYVEASVLDLQRLLVFLGGVPKIISYGP